MKKNKIYILLTLMLMVTSCVPKKEIVYFQGAQNFNNSSSNYEPLIQNDDVLYINISAKQPKAAEPFNLDNLSLEGSSNSSFGVQKQTYLVDNFGNIDFPVIGTLSVAGFSVKGLKDLLKERLAIYLKDPVINIRIMNFKVSILGEVLRPGTIIADSERITLIEALAKAGDLTLYGKRDNILVIRDFQGIKTFNRIDITRADFVNSPFYYLDQNDVVYVEPRKSKIDSTAIGSNVTSIISILGFALTTLFIIIK